MQPIPVNPSAKRNRSGTCQPSVRKVKSSFARRRLTTDDLAQQPLGLLFQCQDVRFDLFDRPQGFGLIKVTSEADSPDLAQQFQCNQFSNKPRRGAGAVPLLNPPQQSAIGAGLASHPCPGDGQVSGC